MRRSTGPRQAVRPATVLLVTLAIVGGLYSLVTGDPSRWAGAALIGLGVLLVLVDVWANDWGEW